MSYEYLIASLPALITLDSPALPAEEFASMCESQLAARDQQTLAQAMHAPAPPDEAKHHFVARWRDRETQLRNACARIRASRRKVDVIRAIRPLGDFSPSLEDAVEQAFDQQSPLEREKALDRIRWNALEELAGPAPFSFDHILAYALKRRIAERWQAMDQDRGNARVDELVKTTVDSPPDDEH